MAIVTKSTMKKVAMGVIAASVGAAAFGYIHYMFLAGQVPPGDIFGVQYTAILPIVLGALGLVAAFGFVHNDTLKAVLMAGSAASIGFGVATAADWIAPKSPAALRARARAPATMYVPPRAMAYAPPVANGALSGRAGIKMI